MASAVLLLAGVLLLAIAPSLVTPLNCTLNFLFTVEKRLLNEHVWNDFFRSASSKALYRVFLHNSVEGGVPPSHFESRPVPPVAAVLPGCSPQTSAILQLLSASTRESGPIDPHIVLPADSVPVKPFTKAYSEFCSSWKVSRIGAGSDTARPRRTASSLCVAPSSQWFIRPTQPSATTTVPSGPTVRHDPWMVLNNTDALAVLAKRTDACGDASSAIASASTSTGDDKAHWWFYHALRGAAVTPPAHLDDEQGHCHTYYAVINATAPGGRPPAVTGAHVAPRWGIRIAPSTTIRTADGAIIDPPLALIGDLVRSPNFFFARGFRGHHHIVGAAQNYTLSEAFHVLQVFGHAPKKAHHHRERGPGDNGGLKVLVVSCDDREMKDRLEDNDYVSMTAVLLHDYTQRHGYDFMKLTGNSSFLVDRVLAKYRDRFFGRYDGIGEHKYGPSAFHPGLLHFRASSWAKIPHVWHAVSEYGEHYDYVWYMDSDAAINPAFRNRSLHDMLTHWQRQTDNTSALAAAAGQRPGAIQSRDVLGQVYWGQRDVRSADLLFFSNFPWRDDLPCAGIFLCRPRRAEPILREWWDYSLESRNRADFMEQDAMWFMLQAAGAGGVAEDPSYGFLINKTNTALISEPEFPSAWFGLNSLWLAHIPNYLPNRLVYFRQMLKMIGANDPVAYGKAVRRVRREAHVSVDILAVAEAMEARHPVEYVAANTTGAAAAGAGAGAGAGEGGDGMDATPATLVAVPKRRTRYPREPGRPGGRADDNWHLARNTHLRPKTPPAGDLLNGFVMTVTGTKDYYLVENSQRRLFPDVHTFEKMGYTKDLLLWVGAKSAEASIPLGPPLPRVV